MWAIPGSDCGQISPPYMDRTLHNIMYCFVLAEFEPIRLCHGGYEGGPEFFYTCKEKNW